MRHRFIAGHSSGEGPGPSLLLKRAGRATATLSQQPAPPDKHPSRRRVTESSPPSNTESPTRLCTFNISVRPRLPRHNPPGPELRSRSKADSLLWSSCECARQSHTATHRQFAVWEIFQTFAVRLVRDSRNIRNVQARGSWRLSSFYPIIFPHCLLHDVHKTIRNKCKICCCKN